MARPRIAFLVFALTALLLTGASAGTGPPRRQDYRHALGACSASHAKVRAAAIRRSRDATLCLLNRVRTRHGLAPLRLNAKLAHAADRHSRDMVRHRYFAHNSRDGRSPFDRVRDALRAAPRELVAGREHCLGQRLARRAGRDRARMAAQPAAPREHPQPPLPRHRDRDRRGGAGRRPGRDITTDFGRHS